MISCNLYFMSVYSNVFFLCVSLLNGPSQMSYHLMTDPYAEDNLEQIYPQPTCKHEECQVLYGKYKAIYEKYYKNLERVHTLTHENQLLSCDVKHKVALLELDKEQLGLMIEQEKQVSDILLHKTPVSVHSVHGGEHPVCDNCMHHREALILQIQQ